MDSENICISCGNILNEGDKYCPKCGKVIAGDVGLLSHSSSRSYLQWIIILGALLLIVFIFIHLNVIKYHPNQMVSEETTENKLDSKDIEGITFGKDIDYFLNTVEPNTMFKKGNVYIRLQSSDRFQVPYLYLYIYKIKGYGFTLYDKTNIEVDPETNILAIPYSFTQDGSYRIVFRKYLDSNLYEGLLTIE